MRILDDGQDQPVSKIWLYLTEEEAADLLTALRERLDDSDPDWHAHIEDHGDTHWELTVAVYDSARLPEDPRIANFLERGEWSR